MGERVLADDRFVDLHSSGDPREEGGWSGTILGADVGVGSPNCSARVAIAITTSSSAVLPARSPMPLMVHST